MTASQPCTIRDRLRSPADGSSDHSSSYYRRDLEYVCDSYHLSGEARDAELASARTGAICNATP